MLYLRSCVAWELSGMDLVNPSFSTARTNKFSAWVALVLTSFNSLLACKMYICYSKTISRFVAPMTKVIQTIQLLTTVHVLQEKSFWKGGSAATHLRTNNYTDKINYAWTIASWFVLEWSTGKAASMGHQLIYFWTITRNIQNVSLLSFVCRLHSILFSLMTLLTSWRATEGASYSSLSRLSSQKMYANKLLYLKNQKAR